MNVDSDSHRSPRKPRLLFLISEDWYFWSHRLPLAQQAKKAGFEVMLATRINTLAEKIEDEGFHLIRLGFPRGGCNPLKELAALCQIVRIYRTYQPDIVHHVSIKSVYLGTWAARLAGVPATVNAFAGLGYLFIADGLKSMLARAVIKTILRWTLRGLRMPVIVQNEEDRQDLVRSKIVSKENVVLIRGAGVDPQRFLPRPEPRGQPVVIMASRMLWSKGVAQFVEAAKYLRSQGVCARFVVVGRIDTKNPDHIPAAQLRAWQRKQQIEWWGNCSDMPNVLGKATIVCLPTFYGEGLPKVLLEAAACGKPIIATDIRGCREICRHGVNGLLIEPRDSGALAEAVQTLFADDALRHRLGAAGRSIVLKEFSAEYVADRTVKLYKALVKQQNFEFAVRSRAA